MTALLKPSLVRAEELIIKTESTRCRRFFEFKTLIK